MLNYDKSKDMKILAIETSCDDTGAAVLEVKDSKFKILSNVVSSQVKLHSKYGGVWPFLAKREHQKNLPLVLKKALKMAKDAKAAKLDLIAVTMGPGLEPCLWSGVNFANHLAKKLNLPLVPINHVEAHVLVNLIDDQRLIINNLPAVCLVVSGGHTQLVLMRGFGEYIILGETRDDAAGECFDKTARILGLGYPGGPAIASQAAKSKNQGLKSGIHLPRPMIHQKNYDFSFSGLKTAVLYLVKKLTVNSKQLTVRQKREIAAEIQQAIIDVLIYKTFKAAKDYRTKSIILGGGVAANKELRKQFAKRIKKEMPGIKYVLPDTKYCTDNAVMTAVTGYLHRDKPIKNVGAQSNLRL
jgi:N6-L-threonylcarbamoyladenine synthase